MSPSRRLAVVVLTAAVALGGMVLAPVAGPAVAAPLVPNGTPSVTPDTGGTRMASSTNWAGWDTGGAKYTSVSAQWRQPAVRCPGTATSYSAFWVGLDGDGSSSVEQTGTAADCVRGTPHYYAWSEFYPAKPVDYSSPVRVGDLITATVSYAGSTGHYSLTIRDVTRGWTHTTTGTAPRGKNASAEVIAEAPTSGSTVLPLADFGSVHFANCTVNGKPLGTVATPTHITMQQGATVKAVTSGLTTRNAFTVTWRHA